MMFCNYLRPKNNRLLGMKNKYYKVEDVAHKESWIVSAKTLEMNIVDWVNECEDSKMLVSIVEMTEKEFEGLPEL